MTTTQKLSGHSIARIFLASMLATGFFYSCEKDENLNTPAHKINVSEKLAIPAAIDLPANPPHGNERVVTYYAEGVQKYKAQLKAGSTTDYEWVFVAPEAKLYDISNTVKGTHGAGPFWQLSAADSIFAQAFIPAKASPSADPGSIDWLLLQPKAGKPQTGVFANVKYIQRIATTGGKAPLIAPTDAAATTEVGYTAVYRFTRIIP